VTIAVAYAIRVTLMHKVGLEATGLYQSAWIFGGMYVSFILQAMGADFYPRLMQTLMITKPVRLVNEQAHVGLLLAGPGIIATFTFARGLTTAIYSSKFVGPVPILRWICLGAALQVVTWPMGFIIVAKGRQNLLIFCELAWAIVSLVLAWFCMGRFGLNAPASRSFMSYVFHVTLLYPIVRTMTGFSWSRENWKTGFYCSVALSVLFFALS
jgi:PST family polysaccharide transporter